MFAYTGKQTMRGWGGDSGSLSFPQFESLSLHSAEMREEAGGKVGDHPGPVYSDIPSRAPECSESPLHSLF